MMPFCRLKETASGNLQVVELFNFNPFEWIPNDNFLKNCMECPSDVSEGMYYINNQFTNDPGTAPPTSEERLIALEEATMAIMEVLASV